MKNLKFLFIAFIVSLTTVSCIVDDEDETLDIVANTPYVIGFSRSSSTVSFFEDQGVVEQGYKVDVIGGQDGTPPDNDIVVTYEIITEQTTASPGVEFDFANSTNTFTIPAGQDFGIIPLNINTGNFNPDMPTTLAINLVSVQNDGAVISAFNQTFSLTFVGCQSDNAGSYTSPDLPSGAGGMATITELDTNTYRISALPRVGFGGTGPVYWDINNICGDLTAISSEIGTLIVAEGTENTDTGQLVFTSIIVYNGTTTASGVWFDLGATTYTPQ